jgi:hypothetical protein
MKVSITERQLKYIISKKVKEKELAEDDAASGSSEGAGGKPQAGTSDKQSGGSGYPEVSKWGDIVKITRGVANPIDYKLKWEDEVEITRGPDNQLK